MKTYEKQTLGVRIRTDVQSRGIKYSVNHNYAAFESQHPFYYTDNHIDIRGETYRKRTLGFRIRTSGSPGASNILAVVIMKHFTRRIRFLIHKIIRVLGGKRMGNGS